MKTTMSLFLFIAFLALGCDGSYKSSSETNAEEERVPVIGNSYVASYPHDTTAFTEGFLIYNGELYESTGSPKHSPQTRSLVGVVDLSTGQIDTKVELDRNKYFGEGIAILNGKVFQLTYKARLGFVYDVDTFQKIGEFTFPSKEGWGMTTDGTHLIMSDGTSRLTVLDPDSMGVVRTIEVTENGGMRDRLNELEYIEGYLYANVWMTNTIVKIDPETGRIVGKLDLTPYASEAKALNPGSLEMNGIAYNPATKKVLVTGKLWPKIYEISIGL